MVASAWRSQPVTTSTPQESAPVPVPARHRHSRLCQHKPTHQPNGPLVNGSLIVIAVAVGAAVLLFANDVIVAVAVAVGLYALGFKLVRHQHAHR